MTPLQRLQDAISKLERREVQGTYGNWMIEVDKTDSASIATTRFSWTKYELETLTIAEGIRTEDADLIVTLHTMLPAVLGWMREQLARMERDVEAVTDESQAIHYRHVLFVADSILDGEQ